MKWFTYATITASLFAFLPACNSSNAEKETKPDTVCVSDSLARIIHIDTVVVSNVTSELKLSGEISFNDNKVVKVFPFSSGQVIQVNVSLGDKVRKGQPLAVIKSAEVAGNYADLSTAGNDVAIARKQLDNAESLYKNGIGSEREYIEAKESYNKAVATAGKVKEQIAINGNGNTAANGTYILRAPMNGYVVEKKIAQGGFLRNDNSDNLFTIGDISDVWVWANVYESDIAKVKEGYTAKVSTLAYPDTVFTGVVDKVSEVLEPVTKVMKIRIRLPNPRLQLKPEMFADILIQNKEGEKMTAIPASAVISDNGHTYVVVYHDRCKLEVRQVQLLKSVGNQAYVKQGVTPGELLISQNQVLLFRALKDN